MGDLPLIEVERYGDALRILVDGKPLGVPVDDSGVRIVAAPGYPSAINVTIPAREVRLVDTAAPKVPDEKRQHIAEHLASKAPPSSWRPKPRT